MGTVSLSPEQYSMMVTALAQSLLISSIIALAGSAPANIIETEDGQYYLQPGGDGADGVARDTPAEALTEEGKVEKDAHEVVGCEWAEWSSLGKCKVILKGTCKKMRTKRPVGGKGGKCTSYLIDAHECDCKDAVASGKKKDEPTKEETEVVDTESDDEGDAEEITEAAGDAEETTEAAGDVEEATEASGDGEETTNAGEDSDVTTEAAGDVDGTTVAGEDNKGATEAAEDKTTPAEGEEEPAEGEEEPAGDDAATTAADGDAAETTEGTDAEGKDDATTEAGGEAEGEAGGEAAGDAEGDAEG